MGAMRHGRHATWQACDMGGMCHVMGGMRHGHVQKSAHARDRFNFCSRMPQEALFLSFPFFLAQTAHTPALGHVADGYERRLTNTPVCVVKEGYQRLPQKNLISELCGGFINYIANESSELTFEFFFGASSASLSPSVATIPIDVAAACTYFKNFQGSS